MDVYVYKRSLFKLQFFFFLLNHYSIENLISHEDSQILLIAVY